MNDSTNPKNTTDPFQGEENLAPPTGYATVTERRFDGSFISGAGNDIFYFNDSFVYGVGDVRGNDFYVIGQYQIGNINLNDVTGDNRVYFDDDFVINYARISGQGLILGYNNGDGGYSELRVRDANTRYKFYLGNNDTSLTVEQLITDVGVTHAPVGTPTKTLTANGVFELEDDTLITASTDFGVTLLGGIGLDVFTLGFSQDGTLNGRAGADYYYLTRFQESTSLNLRDTEGSNHFIVEAGVAIADVDDSGEAIILDLANGGEIRIAGGLTKYSFHIRDLGQGTVTGQQFLDAYDDGVGLLLTDLQDVVVADGLIPLMFSKDDTFAVLRATDPDEFSLGNRDTIFHNGSLLTVTDDSGTDVTGDFSLDSFGVVTYTGTADLILAAGTEYVVTTRTTEADSDARANHRITLTATDFPTATVFDENAGGTATLNHDLGFTLTGSNINYTITNIIGERTGKEISEDNFIINNGTLTLDADGLDRDAIEGDGDTGSLTVTVQADNGSSTEIQAVVLHVNGLADEKSYISMAVASHATNPISFEVGSDGVRTYTVDDFNENGENINEFGFNQLRIQLADNDVGPSSAPPLVGENGQTLAGNFTLTGDGIEAYFTPSGANYRYNYLTFKTGAEAIGNFNDTAGEGGTEKLVYTLTLSVTTTPAGTASNNPSDNYVFIIDLVDVVDGGNAAPAEEHHASLSQNYDIGFSEVSVNGNDRDIDFAFNDSLQFTDANFNDGENLNRDQLWQAIQQGNLDISHGKGDINITFGKADITLSKADGSDFENKFGADNQVDSLSELDAFIALLNVDIA